LKSTSRTRVLGVIVAPDAALSLTEGGSLTRTLAGDVVLGRGCMAANVAGARLGVKKPQDTVNHHPSFLSLRNERRRRPPPLPPARVAFHNCTAATFDPSDQPEVEFINCLAPPGGKGFHDDQYADGAYANHCVSADASATRWDSGDGSEGNVGNGEVLFVDPERGDYRLKAEDRVARGRGAPGLGLDIEGEKRTEYSFDVGADFMGK
jgi:hypothetical protein